MRYPSLAAESPLDLLQLFRSEGVGPVRFFRLVRDYGSAAEVLAHFDVAARRFGQKRPLKCAARDTAEAEWQAMQKAGAVLIPYGGAHYPDGLTYLYDPPPFLIAKGQTSLLTNPQKVAIVGARNASGAGFALARQWGRELAQTGMAVVSGLARGIDTAAHKGALECPEGQTVAVIAGGIDTVFPPENEGLYHEIAARGVIVTEHPAGMAPHAGSFPGRNRIIAGMALGTVVVEAAVGSGSLITAQMALEQGREVMAVPGSPLDPRSKGGNRLIRDGAVIVESAEDIRRAIDLPQPFRLYEPGEDYEAAEDVDGEAAFLREQDAGEERISPEEEELRLREALGAQPVSSEILSVATDIQAARLRALLTELELQGDVVHYPDGTFAKAASYSA